MADDVSSLRISYEASADRVRGGLWMGSAPPPGAALEARFDAVVLAASEYQVPKCFPFLKSLAVQMEDDGTPMRKEDAFSAILASGKVIRWLRARKKVLVTCMQGRNRSGLICCLALCLGDDPVDPDEAIRMVREARGDTAFRNQWFESFLRRYVDRRRQSAGSGIISSGTVET